MAPRWAVVRHDMARGVWGPMPPSMGNALYSDLDNVSYRCKIRQIGISPFRVLLHPHWPVTTDQDVDGLWLVGKLSGMHVNVIVVVFLLVLLLFFSWTVSRMWMAAAVGGGESGWCLLVPLRTTPPLYRSPLPARPPHFPFK